MPHCFGMPVLTLPECNHLAGKTANLCQIRHSCALAYAERLKLDVADLALGEGNQDYPTLVARIKQEERRIKFIPELGKKSELEPVSESDGGEEVVTMASVVPEVKEPKKPKPPRPPSAPKPPRTGEPPMRIVILDILAGAGGWVSKGDLVTALETKLNRSPLNPAALHKISLVLLPKSQAKFGYTVEKKVEKGPQGNSIYSYRLSSGPAQS